jgi:HEAT repeat protein
MNIQVFLEHLKASSNDLYETVIAIKAIGNSGLEGAIEDLKDIINDQKESPIARINAIEAFRRMTPKKVHRALLPIFQDQEDRSDVRMTAFSVIMDSNRVPPKQIIDQIAYTMSHESSEQVKSFVFSKLRALSQSPIYEDKNWFYFRVLTL